MQNNMVSTLFSIDYRYRNLLDAQLVLRADGSSNVQKDSRWLFTPAASVSLNLKDLLLKDIKQLSDWRYVVHGPG